MRDYISLYGESTAGVILDADSLNRVIEFEGDHGISIDNLTITGGFAYDGGGIDCEGCDPNFSNVLITGNKAAWYGGGMSLRYCRPTFSNVIISNNTAGNHSGGIYVRNSAPSFFNATICNNSADGGEGFGEAILVNSIVWYNSSQNNLGGNAISFYSNIQGGWPGIGNINADPMFVDTANGDYRLQVGSPCIDAGIQDTLIIYNNGQDTLIVPPMNYVGSAPDMGAYEFDPTSSIQRTVKIPEQFFLKQNYPNPFNPSTTIDFSIPKSEFVTLIIYNLLGQEVATLVSDKLTPGNYTYTWDASGFASGVYYYKIEAGSLIQTRKLIFMK
jgi:hypothetical protein